MTTQDRPFTEAEEKELEKAAKLLALSSRSTSEHEAASAAAKAQEILTAMNLTTAALERRSGAQAGKREEQAVDGGFYAFQRQIWREVARLNFCMYFTDGKWIKVRANRYGETALRTVWRKHHRLIGRTVNVAATIALASHLCQAIERAVSDRLPEGEQRLGRWANHFREGAADTVVAKVSERFNQRLAEERAARIKAAGEAPAGASGTAVALIDHVEAEKAASASGSS